MDKLLDLDIIYHQVTDYSASYVFFESEQDLNDLAFLDTFKGSKEKILQDLYKTISSSRILFENQINKTPYIHVFSYGEDLESSIEDAEQEKILLVAYSFLKTDKIKCLSNESYRSKIKYKSIAERVLENFKYTSEQKSAYDLIRKDLQKLKQDINNQFDTLEKKLMDKDNNVT